MVPLPIEYIPPVQRPIIIDQQNIPGAHRNGRDVLLAHPLDLVAFRRRQVAEVAEEHVGHADFGDAARAAVAEVAEVVVGVAEPDGLARDGVPVDGGLGLFDGHEAAGLAVRLVDHLEVHVELRSDGGVDEVLKTFLEELGSRGGHVEVGDGDSDLAVVELLEEVGFHVAEDLCSIGNEESSATLGGLFEADEASVRGGALRGRLAVKADVMLPKGRFVHFLVEDVALGGELAEAGGVEGVQAGEEVEGFGHDAVAGDRLGKVEASKPDAAMLEQLLPDHILILRKVLLPLLIVLLRGPDLQGAGGGELGSGLAGCVEVNSLGVPESQGTFEEGLGQVRFGHIRAHELLFT
mmetsp:Transcript_739/g.1288  ORF Transcript_739/g.1288 Transcript_739/m.1288 type:complete len:351 (+) Transcript_739:196-1248(+)